MITLSQEGFENLLFSIKCCAGSSYHATELKDFAKEHGIEKQMDDLIETIKQQQSVINELKMYLLPS